jgi:hypothetical protein
MTSKIILLSFIPIIICFSSCKDDYTCTCKYGNGYNNEYYRSAEVATYHNVTKSSAKKKCEAEEAAHWAKYAPYGVTPTDSLIECTVK